MAVEFKPLTRRRSNDDRIECWHIYHDDVLAGSIALRVGNPVGSDPYVWSAGFYPGSHPRESSSGTSATFDEARVAFETAWRRFLEKRTQADFDEWREQQEWTELKYLLLDAGKALPVPASLASMRDAVGRSV